MNVKEPGQRKINWVIKTYWANFIPSMYVKSTEPLCMKIIASSWIQLKYTKKLERFCYLYISPQDKPMPFGNEGPLFCLTTTQNSRKKYVILSVQMASHQPVIDPNIFPITIVPSP